MFTSTNEVSAGNILCTRLVQFWDDMGTFHPGAFGFIFNSKKLMHGKPFLPFMNELLIY